MDTNDYQEIKQLFDEYLQMYASRDDRLTEHFSEDFSGFTGGGDFLVKERQEWVAITRQDFAQVKEPLRIDLKDLAIQSLSDTIAVTTGFFNIHLPIKDHILSRETARLVLIFRKESAGWKISHSSISIPYYLVREGEVYPMQELVERNQALEKQVAERTMQLSMANEYLSRVIEEQKKAQEQLDDRNRLLDTLLTNLPIGVFMVEAPSGKPLIANSKALELLGRGILPDTNKESLTEVYEAYKYGTKDRYPVEQMPLVRGMNGEVSSVDDLLIIRPDGTSKLLGISGTPVLDVHGHPWASLVCFQDITESKEYENEKLKNQKLESLGVLAGGIAHDFNNILTGIIGNISLAKIFVDDTHKAYNPLIGAEKASMRATELARQLLTFAKGGDPVKKVFSLQNLVNECVSLVLHGSNVKCTVDIPDSIHAIEADDGQISQAIHNIIINATQAMPGGGVLTLSAQNEILGVNNSMTLPPGTYICLKCADEGCGISAGDLKKIFDPYFTTKVSGTGLGLASTHSIIIRHGGHISVSSIVERGTTFKILLPSIGETFSEYKAEAVSQMLDHNNGGSILVMDDEEMIRELATAMLQEIGYEVTTCDNGNEAIRYYSAARKAGTPFTAVIMDLTIPGGLGGKEAAKEILSIDPTACLIVSSGYSNDPIMSDYSSYGFAGAIAKPYRISGLAQILRITN